MNKRITLVHDFLLYHGGAEKVLTHFMDMFPEASIYTLLYDEKKLGHLFPKEKVITSFLQEMPGFLKKRHKWLGVLMPSATEHFDFREYDAVLSSSAAFSKGIIVRPQTTHFCYVHSPARFMWDYQVRYAGELAMGKTSKLLARLLAHYLRIWDSAGADRPDYLIANSQTTRKRIQKYWRRDAEVIYPPLEDSVFNLKKDDVPAIGEKDYFLMVSRLSPYKKVDVAVAVANKMSIPLVVIGDGSEKKRLEALAGPTVKIIPEHINNTILKAYYQNARALIMPQEEDFGLAAVEAMGCGTPVIAYGRGGATETIRDGINGQLFFGQGQEALAHALGIFLKRKEEYHPQEVSASVAPYSEVLFRQRMLDLIESKLTKTSHV
jgi:glycosyltransferase involved in cell wall biosynthesis